jgi:hypothetical protein
MVVDVSTPPRAPRISSVFVTTASRPAYAYSPAMCIAVDVVLPARLRDVEQQRRRVHLAFALAVIERRPCAMFMKPVAVLWPKPREPKCTPTHTAQLRLRARRRSDCRCRPCRVAAAIWISDALLRDGRRERCGRTPGESTGSLFLRPTPKRCAAGSRPRDSRASSIRRRGHQVGLHRHVAARDVVADA